MIGPEELVNVRTALLITLSVLLVVLLWRRLRQHVLTKEMPAILHVEIVGLQPAYHPVRLIVEIHAPEKVSVDMRVLSEEHKEMQRLLPTDIPPGTHVVEQRLIDLVDGAYFLEMTSPTQRTLRQFRLQQI